MHAWLGVVLGLAVAGAAYGGELGGGSIPETGVEPGPVEQISVPGLGRVPYQRLFEVVSEPGESLDTFAARIGPRLRAYSDATAFEACGVLATDGTRLGVVIGTNGAHIACANFESKVPNGMRSTGQTIHSHGGEKSFNANRADKALLGGQLGGRAVATVHGQTLDAFSPLDFDGGPGYLATPTGMKHQDGTSQVRDVGIER